MYSKVKLFGHPIHPMLVAFPVAAYTGTLATFVVYDVNGHPFWLNAAIALNVAGVCAAVLAALPGLVDWLFGIPRRSGAKTVGLFHAFFNVAALGLFLASIDRYADSWNAGAADGRRTGMASRADLSRRHPADAGAGAGRICRPVDAPDRAAPERVRTSWR
jgi:hypothetical protein